MVAQSPKPPAHVLNARAFRIELEFRNVGFWGEGKTGVPGEKPLGAEKRTNNKLNSHMTSIPGIEPGPHWWKASALTTAPSLRYRHIYLYMKHTWSKKQPNGQRVLGTSALKSGKTFSGNFLRAVYPHRLRINSKKTKTQCLSYFLVWKTMMVLKADDRCHATVHKGLQTLVWISCTWESMQKKLVCRRISCPWSKVRSWMMLIVLYLYTGGHTR